MLHQNQKILLQWYKENARPLPWRDSTDPYRIWISEVMLQQTTATAVIPFYQKFLRRFPNLKTLAHASLEEVYEQWAGLGYYSRAKNLWRSAQAIYQLPNFPNRTEDLLSLPGFGPYTARAVASFAFGEKVGVLDGNVIRVISRYLACDEKWWEPKTRMAWQKWADDWAKRVDSGPWNQAMMEWGATVCTPQSPRCVHCPLMPSCRGYKMDLVTTLPLKKPKRPEEIWLWQPFVWRSRKKLAIVQNDHAPFLKKQWSLPGQASRLKKAPKDFDFRHRVTHHNIFVKVSGLSRPGRASKKLKWVDEKEIKKFVPTSLAQKTLQWVGLKE